MLPDRVLSSHAMIGNLLPPRDYQRRWNFTYTRGGDNINDTTNGLESKFWRGYISENKRDIIIGVEHDPIVTDTVLLTTSEDMRTFDFTFDQSMRPFAAYETASGSFFYWFDTVPSQFVTTALPAGSVSPRCVLDDPRALELDTSDIILAYIRDDVLFFRAQRDRYLVEYGLYTNIGGRLFRMGMNDRLRLQFEVSVSEV